MTQIAYPNPSRGRPREFDIEAVVERAMQAFWSSGYHGTSLPDLLEATRISRGSLYAAFGDKHGLFLQALDRYIDAALNRMDGEFSAQTSGVACLRDCLAGYVARTSGTDGRRGCLVVATAMELAAHDPEAATRIRRFFDGVLLRLTAALTRAKADGELAEGVEPSATAQLLLCVFEGMRVVGTAGQKTRASGAMIDGLLQRLVK